MLPPSRGISMASTYAVLQLSLTWFRGYKLLQGLLTVQLRSFVVCLNGVWVTDSAIGKGGKKYVYYNIIMLSVTYTSSGVYGDLNKWNANSVWVRNLVPQSEWRKRRIIYEKGMLKYCSIGPNRDSDRKLENNILRSFVISVLPTKYYFYRIK
jgi:hypothetical protein